MIEVTLYLQFQRERHKIASNFWKMRPAGTADEITATARKIKAEMAKIEHTLEQLKRYPESGPVKAGLRRKITVPDSPYVITYQVAKDLKRVYVLNIRDGARKPIKW
jgi:hypothetical protein